MIDEMKYIYEETPFDKEHFEAINILGEVYVLAMLAIMATRPILDLQAQFSRILMAIAAKLATHCSKRPKNAPLEYISKFRNK